LYFRRVLAGSAVIALSFGVGGMAYSQVSPGAPTAGNGSNLAGAPNEPAPATSASSLAQAFSQMATVAAHSHAPYVLAGQAPGPPEPRLQPLPR
jgi:hypothetical protein